MEVYFCIPAAPLPHRPVLPRGSHAAVRHLWFPERSHSFASVPLFAYHAKHQPARWFSPINAFFCSTSSHGINPTGPAAAACSRCACHSFSPHAVRRSVKMRMRARTSDCSGKRLEVVVSAGSWGTFDPRVSATVELHRRYGGIPL